MRETFYVVVAVSLTVCFESVFCVICFDLAFTFLKYVQDLDETYDNFVKSLKIKTCVS